MRSKIIVLLFVVLIPSLLILYNFKNKKSEFDFSQVQFDFPYQEEWKSPPLHPELAARLDQQFIYLGKGARSFAFLGADGQTVLKFFKSRYHRPHWTLRYLPPIFPFDAIRKKKAKKVLLKTVLQGYQIALEQDPEGTGLLYTHLNVEDEREPYYVTLHNRLGQPLRVDLNSARYVLQERVTPLVQVLTTHILKGEKEEAKRALSKVVDLYHSHHDQGLFDQGIGLLENNGFYEGKAVHFDVGKLTKDSEILDSSLRGEAFESMSLVLDKWLKKHFPDSHEELMDHYRKII